MQSLRAFTMIELIMVVVVIGMVAMFAIPNYTKSVNKTYVRTGKNNLMIMYSAQKIKNTGGILYQSCGSTAACNAALELSVIGNGIDYTCTGTGGPPVTGFYCYASRAGEFKLKNTETTADPCCCVANACPSVSVTCASCP